MTKVIHLTEKDALRILHLFMENDLMVHATAKKFAQAVSREFGVRYCEESNHLRKSV